MKLPQGTDAGVVTNPKKDKAVEQLIASQGTIDIDSPGGHGFILTRKGNFVAACFRDKNGNYYAKDALDRISTGRPDNIRNYIQGIITSWKNSGERKNNDSLPRLSVRLFSVDEFQQASEICQKKNLIITGRRPESGAKVPSPLDEKRLRKLLSLYGIIAISTFYEGFAVQSMGDADFEHVAALAEDFLRAGIKIIREMEIGNLSQLILETGTNKIIIAPCGDLYLCVFAREDAQLGMLRVAIKNLQMELLESG